MVIFALLLSSLLLNLRVTAAPSPPSPPPPSLVALGRAAYWFVDDSILSSSSNLSIHVQRPSDPSGWRTIFTSDRPWEQGLGCYCAGNSVVQIPANNTHKSVVRLYYDIRNCSDVTFKGFPEGDRWSVTAIAESTDGIVFTKPTLGLLPFRGSSASHTNLVAMADGTPCFLCGTVFIDSNIAEGEDGRFKSCVKNERISEISDGSLLSRGMPVKPGSLACVKSRDGLTWTILGSMLIGSVDTQTNVLFDPTRSLYQIFTRLWWGSWRKPGHYAISAHRCVRRLVQDARKGSDMILNASLWRAENATSVGQILPGCQGHGCDANQTAVMCPDARDWDAFPPEEPGFPPLDYYGATLLALPPAEVYNTVLMFAERHWHYSSQCWEPEQGLAPGHKPWGPHTKEAGLAVSRDGGASFQYSDEPRRESVIGIGMEGSSNISRSTWVVPTPVRLGGKLLIYLDGLNSDEIGGLDPNSPTHTRHAGTMVAVTRDAGLAALAPSEAGYGSSGEATTHALQVCTGCQALVLNVDCHGYGSVAVGLQHANGTSLPGYSFKEAMLIAGRSSTNAVVFWRASKDALLTDGHSAPPTSDIRPAVAAGGALGLRVAFVVKSCSLFSFRWKSDDAQQPLFANQSRRSAQAGAVNLRDRGVACRGWGQPNYTSYYVFERPSVAVPSDTGCYAGLGSRGNWSGKPGRSVSFQVILNGGPEGPNGPGPSLRDAMVFTPPLAGGDDDDFQVQIEGMNQPVQILSGRNYAATVNIHITAAVAPGLYKGQIAMSASSGGVCWAVPYTLLVAKPALDPEQRIGDHDGSLASAVAAARLRVAPHSSSLINVKDYGARGDGQTDDTAAIQLAMCVGSARTMSYFVGSYAISVPEVFFPAGVYILNSTLHPDCPRNLFPGHTGGAPVHLRGEGTPVLIQTDPGSDIVFAAEVWRWRVQGLQFNNGKHHIRIGNNNTDETSISIRGCVFVNASAVAVRAMGHGELGEYYGGIGSAQFTISECQFLRNEQAVVNNCDTMTIQDCWVEGFGYNHSYDKALFVNYDKLILLRMVGVPGGNRRPNSKNRWIDNGPSLGKPEGLFVARDCRFGGESGGMTILVNHVSFLCVHMKTPGVPKWDLPPAKSL